MKPMLYATKNGLAEVTGHQDGYKIKYDAAAIPAVILIDDGEFASWVFRNDAHYLGNYRKRESH